MSTQERYETLCSDTQRHLSATAAEERQVLLTDFQDMTEHAFSPGSKSHVQLFVIDQNFSSKEHSRTETFSRREWEVFRPVVWRGAGVVVGVASE
ncbi:hypothetical protein NQZ68_014968 [Dissostichus eleginoides]|nr:hypothetical protein NQZ68_014968 [Dissostichus eleginoides]